MSTFYSRTPAWGNSPHWKQLPNRYFYKTFSVNVKGLLFTVQKGSSTLSERRFDHSERINRIQNRRWIKCLWRNQSRRAIIRTLLDRRAERPQDQGERHQSWSDDIPGLRGLLVVWLRVKNRSSRSRRSLYPPYQWNVWEVLTKLQKSSHSSRLMIAVLSPVANCLSMEVWHKSERSYNVSYPVIQNISLHWLLTLQNLLDSKYCLTNKFLVVKSNNGYNIVAAINS